MDDGTDATLGTAFVVLQRGVERACNDRDMMVDTRINHTRRFYTYRLYTPRLSAQHSGVDSEWTQRHTDSGCKTPQVSGLERGLNSVRPLRHRA